MPGDARSRRLGRARAPAHDSPSLGALLGDGMDPERDGLWRRWLGLGPAPEYCLLAAEAPAGVGAGRLPTGWTARDARARDAVGRLSRVRYTRPRRRDWR